MKIILTGQALLQSDIRVGSPQVVGDMRPLLDGDAVFTNFESMIVQPGGSLDDLPPDDTGHHGPPEMLDALMDMGFNIMAMSNNHSYDLLERGILNLMQEAEARALPYAGVGANLDDAARPAYLETAQGRVALVSMVTGLVRDGGAASASHAGSNELAMKGGQKGIDAGHPDGRDVLRILGSISTAREHADFVISYNHNHVYDKDFIELVRDRHPDRELPPNWTKSWSRQQIDAGADIVVMHGLPLVQGLEIYRGRPIFYNLGNFLFQLTATWKDLFEEAVFDSVVASVEFSGNSLAALSFRPIVLDPGPSGDARFLSGIPKPATGEKARAILERIVALSRPFGTELSIRGDVAELIFPSRRAVR